jgi:dihydrofolate reductase
MKKIRYSVAMSLDGYIAGPNGEADWITIDPDINFTEIWAQFDTLLMGRRTYEAASARLGRDPIERKRAVVISRTLRQTDHPGVTVLPEPSRDQIQSIRSQSKKDIWLFGGAELFRFLLDMGEVDTVEVSIVPVLLGAGIPLLSPPAHQTKLKLSGHKVYNSGRVSLTYEVQH